MVQHVKSENLELNSVHKIINGGMASKSVEAVFVHTGWSDQTCTREQGNLREGDQTEIARGSTIVWIESVHLTRVRVRTKIAFRIEIDFMHRAFGL